MRRRCRRSLLRAPGRRDMVSCAFSNHYPPENYVIWAISDSLKLMAGWVLRWLSAVRTRLRQRLDLLLEFIVLRHQLAVMQRTGTRRPCFRPSERLFWVLLSRWWANWQRSLLIVQPASVLRWRRRGFCAIWVSGSCGHWRGGRPKISSEVRALIVGTSHENFLWGAPRIHGELLKLGFNLSQAIVSRYMPRRDYPPTQTWRTFLRNQALGIGTIGVGEAGRLSDVLLALVRTWIERVVRCVSMVRDRIPSRLMEPASTLHRLRPYRDSNHTDRRAVHGRCMPVPPWPTAVSVWTLADRRPSPYRSRASPRRKLPSTPFTVSIEGITETEAAGSLNFCTTAAIARMRQANHNPYKAIVLHACHEQPRSRTNDPQCPPLPGDPSSRSAAADKVMRCYGAGR